MKNEVEKEKKRLKMYRTPLISMKGFMMKDLFFFSVFVAILPLAGCNTLKDAHDAKGQGTSRIYNASFDTVWNVVPKAMNELSLPIAGDNKEKGYFLAEKEITAFSYGEKVAVFVDKVGEEQTRVEVVSKKAMITNVGAWNWEKPILDRLGKILEIDKANKVAADPKASKSKSVTGYLVENKNGQTFQTPIFEDGSRGKPTLVFDRE